MQEKSATIFAFVFQPKKGAPAGPAPPDPPAAEKEVKESGTANGFFQT